MYLAAAAFLVGARSQASARGCIRQRKPIVGVVALGGGERAAEHKLRCVHGRRRSEELKLLAASCGDRGSVSVSRSISVDRFLLSAVAALACVVLGQNLRDPQGPVRRLLAHTNVREVSAAHRWVICEDGLVSSHVDLAFTAGAASGIEHKRTCGRVH